MLRLKRPWLWLVAFLAAAETVLVLTLAAGTLDLSWTLTFLAWQWLGIAGLVVGFGVLAGRRSGRSRRWTLGVATLLTAPLPLLVVLSWIARLRTGRFLDVEALRMVASDARMIWLYLRQTEPVVIAGLVVAVPLVVVGWGGLLWTAGQSRRSDPSSDSHRRMIGLAWVALGLLVAAPLIGIGVREDTPVDRHRGTPLSTLTVSMLVHAPAATDPACLGTESLVSLDERPAVPSAADRHVILVAVESLRADVVGLEHQGREVMPNLNRLVAEGVLFRRVWGPSTHSDYADVAVLSSLYPLRSRRHHYYRASDPWPKTLIYDVLDGAGYRTALISAQNEAWGGMAEFLDTPGLDLFYDARTGEALGIETRTAEEDLGFAYAVTSGRLRAGKLDDGVVADRAVDWIRDRSTEEEPFFLAVNFQSSHFPYELGDDAPRPFGPATIDFAVSFGNYPREKTEIVRNAYYNALAYIDTQIGRLLAALAEAGLEEEVIVAVYGENGEMFHEHGLVTHARAPYEPALRVPVVLRGPELAASVNDEAMSLLDLVPTVLGLLDERDRTWPPFQGRDVLGSRQAESPERTIFFHNLNAWTRVDGLVLGGRWKYWHDRESGRDHLFDLETDPGETRNLARRRPQRTRRLADLTATWRCRQLAYYQNPLFYTRYYPPSPPRWHGW